MSKTCRHCGELKPSEAFGPSPKSLDGLYSFCRDCVNLKARERRAAVRHSEKVSVLQKKCTSCKRLLCSALFHKDSYQKDGLQPSCKKCCLRLRQQYQEKNKSNYVQLLEGQSRCSICKTIKDVTEFHIQRAVKNGIEHRCKSCMAERHRSLRVDVLSRYSNGTPECSCCGERALEFLSVDHIEGGGKAHREQIRGSCMYRWLKRNGYPEGYRVLCHNCNQSYGFYGYCPHQRRDE